MNNIITALLSVSLLCTQISIFLHNKACRNELRDIKYRLNFVELNYEFLKDKIR